MSRVNIRPRVWLAVLLALVSFGLGQFYAGKRRRALLIVVAATLATPVAFWLAPVHGHLVVCAARPQQQHAPRNGSSPRRSPRQLLQFPPEYTLIIDCKGKWNECL